INRVAPAMPNPSKGTEFCKLLLSQASKDMQEPLVPMLFPILEAHLPVGKNQPEGLIWKDFCIKQPLSHAKMAIVTR
ncbi:MAG: hypothetical protein J6T78_03450, partial [Bacteroidaceae bacterium]|nr:hypothetical protein [Bacteroidaceae bacterium]